MKTFLACILAAVIASSNGFLLSLLGGDSNQHAEPQEYLHHHHHHHEVVHKSVPVEQHYVQQPVELQPQHVRIFKVIHETAPSEEYGAAHGHAPVPVLTKVIQPVVNKNFYQSRHEHHYHQVHHGGPVFHHRKW